MSTVAPLIVENSPGRLPARRLRVQQDRIAAVLDALPESGWTIRLPAAARGTLVTTGHFREYSGELDWTPRQVAGHLRDSARFFAGRLRRLLAGDTTPLEDFDPLEPARVRGYAAGPLPLLLADLHDAQEQVRFAVAAVGADDLARTGRRPSGEEVTVGWLLEFLPGHQADHAAQLEALAVAALGA